MAAAVLRQESTNDVRRLHLAIEMGSEKWLLALGDGRRERQVEIHAHDYARLEKELGAARKRFKLRAECHVVSCYEAGRDGFSPHRVLANLGLENYVVDPASIEVDRRAKRAKTDRLDAQRLLGQLIRFAGGETRALRPVRVPSREVEDARRPQRERERLVKEHTQHVNRIKGLLASVGIALKRVDANFERFLAKIGAAVLGKHLLEELRREHERLLLVRKQRAEITAQYRARIKAPQNEMDVKVQQLALLSGIGPVSAFLLVHEFFGWRQFKNRRQIGALAGLVGVSFSSGKLNRDQGISKAGNARVRGLAIELAWAWLRYQPDSKISKWFHEYVGHSDPTGKKRLKRVAIVAVARRLLIALWHYLETAAIPEGAVIKGARKQAQRARKARKAG